MHAHLHTHVLNCDSATAQGLHHGDTHFMTAVSQNIPDTAHSSAHCSERMGWLCNIVPLLGGTIGPLSHVGWFVLIVWSPMWRSWIAVLITSVTWSLTLETFLQLKTSTKVRPIAANGAVLPSPLSEYRSAICRSWGKLKRLFFYVD